MGRRWPSDARPSAGAEEEEFTTRDKDTTLIACRCGMTNRRNVPRQVRLAVEQREGVHHKGTKDTKKILTSATTMLSERCAFVSTKSPVRSSLCVLCAFVVNPPSGVEKRVTGVAASPRSHFPLRRIHGFKAGFPLANGSDVVSAASYAGPGVSSIDRSSALVNSRRAGVL
jgi:hypothetical protein